MEPASESTAKQTGSARTADKRLHFKNAYLSEPDIATAYGSIQVLMIEDCFSDDWEAVMTAVAALRFLTELRVSGCYIEGEFSWTLELPRLKILVLSN